MRSSPQMLALFGSLLLIGCQPQSTLPPVEGPTLPSQMPESFAAAFAQTPEVTAHRFLQSYDRFAESGPVSRARVLDYTRMQDALERGRLLGYVLALDMNGDARITQAEFESFKSFPKGPNKLLKLEDLFRSDDNQDGVISMQEAVVYSRKLHTRAGTQDMRGIESHFMLFDANGDDVVERREMIGNLYNLLPERKTESAGLRPATPQ